MNNEYPEGYGFEYFSLVRKSDSKEVYTSPNYSREDCSDVFDFPKIWKTLNFYFTRVNSGIQQQIENTKIPEEQKKNLKLLDKKDYIVEFRLCVPIGMCKKVFWWKEAVDFIRD